MYTYMCGSSHYVYYVYVLCRVKVLHVRAGTATGTRSRGSGVVFVPMACHVGVAGVGGGACVLMLTCAQLNIP